MVNHLELNNWSGGSSLDKLILPLSVAIDCLYFFN